LDKEQARGREARLQLASEPASAAAARGFVRSHLRRHGMSDDAVEAALLVSSELVTNAYLHGEGEIELRLSVDDDRVRIEVNDKGRGQAPAVREQKPDDHGGWGLRIVDQLSRRWGVSEGTTHVWAELAVS
jgi:anti-sigma regulatory factor (Ser/Thr protein kinase)